MTLVVEAKGLSKVFGTGDEAVHALSAIDLQMGEGDFISLIGPSGCGKSTLLRLIGDLARPTAGELSINGKPPQQARLDRDYGMVFQSATLLDWRTVRKNVELPLEIMDVPAAERSIRANQMLGLVQHAKAYERLTIRAATSGDRVLALRALLSNPLVPDYPTASGLLTAIFDANRDHLPRFRS